MPPDQTNPLTSTRQWARLAVAAVAVLALVGACKGPPMLRDWKVKQQREEAYAMWQERCKKSGEFIHKTVEGVEGVYLVNVRTHKDNYNQGEQPEDQFRLSDPYGDDLTDDGYLVSLLRDSYHYAREKPWPAEFPPHKGYLFVEATAPKDRKLYRFTGRVEEPWQTDKSYLQGYTRFVLDRTPIDKRSARYGVKFDDISTREEREHWIAGSSLKVIDLETGEVLGERIGYMVDWAQGSRAGARQPWTFAADNACPTFDHDFPESSRDPYHRHRSQPRQTQRFVEKVLKPLN